ncbi:NAD-dependent epimerase/dehydratase family protein [Pararhizobium sp.]|uniref:NAD-dependent epimerase/dehydratase family protein n=1 Tax=Pararhizobium sp. TaxID=1977563 RepID=UPI0027218306|nr:NAD-dependent epimerase/dehydratase family protein [Pararhizobium sp.]MDO9418333.1 NAD-dependent epimerase/dehydratase family protein [Pararhizobium sp.]
MKNVVVTGAKGFVGAKLCNELAKRGYAIFPFSFSQMLAGSAASFPKDVEYVVHLAARVHIMSDAAVNPMDEYRAVNVAGTIDFARLAAVAGCRRFVFVSSIKVNGESTLPGQYFTADDNPAPQDPYAISKDEAENQLKRLSRETGMEVVIIRPPLVYGPGVRANFLSLMRLLDRGVPLPFGAIKNHRSFVYLENLIDFIIVCLNHPAAANDTFLVSDDEDLSTPDLLSGLGSALGRPARLIPVPQRVLRAAAQFFGKQDMATRLLGSLRINICKNKEILNWKPSVRVVQGLADTADWYSAGKRNVPIERLRDG